jgi:hypothetical protein
MCKRWSLGKWRAAAAAGSKATSQRKGTNNGYLYQASRTLLDRRNLLTAISLVGDAKDEGMY